MVALTFVTHDGQEQIVEATSGHSVMEAARNGGIDGIVAECCGALACATCHAYFDPTIVAQLDPPSADEEDMLEFAAAPRTENSRLSCQVIVTEAMRGTRIEIPQDQL